MATSRLLRQCNDTKTSLCSTCCKKLMASTGVVCRLLRAFYEQVEGVYQVLRAAGAHGLRQRLALRVQQHEAGHVVYGVVQQLRRDALSGSHARPGGQ